jgi:hypothetical protein
VSTYVYLFVRELVLRKSSGCMPVMWFGLRPEIYCLFFFPYIDFL